MSEFGVAGSFPLPDAPGNLPLGAEPNVMHHSISSLAPTAVRIWMAPFALLFLRFFNVVVVDGKEKVVYSGLGEY